MKKIIFIIAIVAIASVSFSQTSNSWRIGIHLTSIDNPSNYSGGSGDANAIFEQRNFNSGALDLTWRYFCNEHWSFQSGLTFGELGFSFSMAKDYSLLNKQSQYAVNNAGLGIAQIPLTAFYDFKPNCKNSRFYIGAGISVLSRTDSSAKTVNAELSDETATSSSALYLNQTINSGNSISLTGQLMLGIERTLKNGGMIQVGLVFNKGTKDIASTTVNYNINNKAYTHKFKNRGDYWGITLGYYFREHQKK
ncbi:MAG: hypothetical protein PHD97_07900 [Bacteroidales bacterium]|nr:hypothetical protein [Bacteroidales bacterium]